VASTWLTSFAQTACKGEEKAAGNSVGAGADGEERRGEPPGLPLGDDGRRGESALLRFAVAVAARPCGLRVLELARGPVDGDAGDGDGELGEATTGVGDEARGVAPEGKPKPGMIAVRCTATVVGLAKGSAGGISVAAAANG